LRPKLQILTNRLQLLVLIERVAQKNQVRLDLSLHFGLMGSFEDNFEGPGVSFGSGAKHAGITFANESVSSHKVIDGRITVARENFFRRLQRGFDHMLRHLGAESKSIEPLRFIVRMQGNEPVKTKGADLALQ